MTETHLAIQFNNAYSHDLTNSYTKLWMTTFIIFCQKWNSDIDTSNESVKSEFKMIKDALVFIHARG